ncbi:uncharacterized protein LOC135143863 [Zophobas morio]|uniref:uncharacterized protein LOC135143863 n=1 Tax=Zophobas morio TaxID=2755281 RepID=UPI003082E333
MYGIVLTVLWTVDCVEILLDFLNLMCACATVLQGQTAWILCLMDNPVVRDLVAELLRGEDPAAAGHRPKSRGIQVGPPMGVAPQLVSRRVQTDGEAPRRDPVARYVPVDQEVCWHCARPGHCRGQCPYPAGPKFCSRCGLVGTTSAACQCGLPERPRRSCPRRPSSGEVRRSISRDSPLPSPRVSPSRRTNAVRGPTGSRM